MSTAEIIVSIIGAVLASGLIQFFISRNDGKTSKLDRIEQKLDNHIAEDDKRDAVQCRVRIIQFADDLRQGIERSKNSYEQCLADIDNYDRYCKSTDFRNGITTASEEYIKTMYRTHLSNNDFIA